MNPPCINPPVPGGPSHTIQSHVNGTLIFRTHANPSASFPIVEMRWPGLGGTHSEGRKPCCATSTDNPRLDPLTPAVCGVFCVHGFCGGPWSMPHPRRGHFPARGAPITPRPTLPYQPTPQTPPRGSIPRPVFAPRRAQAPRTAPANGPGRHPPARIPRIPPHASARCTPVYSARCGVAPVAWDYARTPWQSPGHRRAK